MTKANLSVKAVKDNRRSQISPHSLKFSRLSLWSLNLSPI